MDGIQQDKYKPSQKEQKIISHIDDKYSSSLKDRFDMEKEWYLALLFFQGKQWQVFDEISNRFKEEKAPSYRVRLTANHVYPMVKAKIAQLLKARPIFTVLPNTGDQADIQASKIGEKLLKHLWREMDMDTIVHELSAYIFTTGTCFLKYYWNSSKGKAIGVSKNGIQLFQGDITVECVSPFEIAVDKNCTKMEDAQWVIQAKRTSINALKNRFYKHAKYIKYDSDQASGEFYKDRLQSASPLGFASVVNSMEDNDSTIIKEYWCKPCGDYPDGLHAIVAGGVLLFQEPLVKEKGDLPEIPVIKFDETIFPGRFWGISSTMQGIPLQKEYNKSISQVVESKNLSTRPKVLAPKGHGINPSSFTTEPGEFIEYKYPNKPEYMQLPPLPSYVFENINRVLNDFRVITAVGETSLGSKPEGTRTGLELQVLAEQDQSRIATTIQLFERNLAVLGARMLAMCQNKYKEDRIIKIVGENHEPEYISFKGSDLKGNFDVQVQTASSLDQNKAAKRAQITQLIQYGFITPQTSRPSKILEMLDVGSTEAYYDANTQHESFAKYENVLMSRGEQAIFKDYQDHDTHIAEHNQFRNNIAFLKLPKSVQAYFDFHINKHTEAKDAQNAAQMQQAGQMQQLSQGQDQMQQLQGGGGGEEPAPEEEMPQ